MPVPISSRGNADVSRNELRRGRRKRGPYDIPALFYQKALSRPFGLSIADKDVLMHMNVGREESRHGLGALKRTRTGLRVHPRTRARMHAKSCTGPLQRTPAICYMFATSLASNPVMPS